MTARMTKRQEEITINQEEFDALGQKVSELSEYTLDLETKLKTALADYQNMRHEIETQQAMQQAMVKKRVFSDLIELFTDIFYAVEQLPTEIKDSSSLQGISLILAKYTDLLKNHGVTEITFAEGDDYDASKAEVLGVLTHNEYDLKVAQTIQPGYRIGEVMIKPARVMIYRKEMKKPIEVTQSETTETN
jgi:molecular chaperone GrpE (heat shock protein)